MKYVGVDGCRAGWLSVALEEDDVDIAVFCSFHELWARHKDSDLILVDIPIGLPGGEIRTRKADGLARKELRSRRSSIFTPGARSIHNCRTYADACEENRKATDKMISLQYWNIMPKVKDVDSFLQATPEAVTILRETHPEMCFEKSADKSMDYAKKTVRGIAERIEIITHFIPDGKSVYSQVLNSYLRKDVARDDIVDAMILAATARESRGEMISLPNPLEMDERNLPMAIWYYDFERKPY